MKERKNKKVEGREGGWEGGKEKRRKKNALFLEVFNVVCYM
jgi:hypothetical protein